LDVRLGLAGGVKILEPPPIIPSAITLIKKQKGNQNASPRILRCIHFLSIMVYLLSLLCCRRNRYWCQPPSKENCFSWCCHGDHPFSSL